MASLLKTAHLFPKDTDFSSRIPTSASRLYVESIQVGKGKPMGTGEFFPFELITKEPGRGHRLRFWLGEVTYNSKIFAPHGKTSFMVKEEDVINDLLTVEKGVQSMNLFPKCEFKSLLKTVQTNFRGQSYDFTSVWTKVSDKSGIFENGEKSTLEKLESVSSRKASAILLLTGIYRNDECNSYHITSRLEQIMWRPMESRKENVTEKPTTADATPPAKCQKLDKQHELNRLNGYFMKDFLEKKMDQFLLVASDYPCDDGCDYIFMSPVIQTVLDIENQIQSSEDLSIVLSHLTETHDSMVKSYNQTYMAQPRDNYGWSEMRTESLKLEIFNIYTLVLKSLIVLDDVRSATPIPSTQEAFREYCEINYRFYHIWLSLKEERMDWENNLKHLLALPLLQSILNFFPHLAFLDAFQMSDENLMFMKNLKNHPFHSIMKDFICMVEEKLITKRRFNQALMEINRYLTSISEGIHKTTSERFLKECFSWGFDRWLESYTKANVPFAQRHGLLDVRCREYFLYIIKMSEKRGREHFGENKWNQMTTIRRKRLAKVCAEGRQEFHDTMVDVDSCAYTIMPLAQIPVNSYKVQC